MIIEKAALEVKDYLKPLCPSTERLFDPVQIKDSDRIRLGMTGDAKHFKATLFSWNKGVETYPSYPASVIFPRRILERRKVSEGVWSFGATDITALTIAAHWKPYQVHFADQVAEQEFQFLVANFHQQTTSVKNAETWNFLFKDSPWFPLIRYQKLALRRSLRALGFALFMEQGTGKTPIVIARICNEALAKQGPYRALIVCPNGVRYNWLAEFHKFATVPGRVVVLRGNLINRIEGVVEAMSPLEGDDKYTVVVASYETVVNTKQAVQMPEYDLIALDESHYVKDPQTERWKALLPLRDRSKRRMILTGTPIGNSVADLYTQLEFLGEGYSGFTSFNAFKKFYGKFEDRGDRGQQQDQASFRRIIGVENAPMLQERLIRCSYVATKKEVLPELPQQMYNIVEVEMTTKQKKAYIQVMDQVLVEIENDLTGEYAQLAIENVLTKLLRGAQITSGFIGIPEERDEFGKIIKERGVIPFEVNPKMDVCMDLIKERPEHEKTIIWAHWREDIFALQRALTELGIQHVSYFGDTKEAERKVTENRFNCDPDCKILIGSAGAGGTGLNLLGYDHSRYWPDGPPTYCNLAIYYSQDWSWLKRSQSQGRNHRKGIVTHTQYTDLVVPGTVDEDIRVAVLRKGKNAMEVQDVRQLVESLKRGYKNVQSIRN